MKKVVSFILAVIMLAVVAFGTGCDEGNLGKLRSKFYDITSNAEHIDFKQQRLVVSYSDFKVGDEFYMLELINKDGPYNNITALNELLDNSLTFTYSYIDICSSKKWKVSSKLSKQVFKDIKDLKSSIEKLDECVLNASNSAKFHYYLDDFKNTNLSDLNKLIKQYVVVITDALELSKDIQNIYDSAILKTNIELNDIEVNDFDTSRVINYIDYIRKANIVDMTDVYVNSYLDNKEFLKTLTSDTFDNIDLDYSNYSAKVSILKSDINFTSAKARADANKQEFLDASILMSNALRILKNEYIKYLAVKHEIKYAESSYKQDDMINNAYIDIIKSYNQCVQDCSTLIDEVLLIIIG